MQAAVDAAAAGSTITICQGSYDGNVTIGKNLTLVGAGADDTKLKGTGGSVVTVAQNVTATVSAVTISGGTGTPNEGFLEGGGVFNRGTLTLIDVVVTGNQAERGGGILNFDEVDLTLDHTIVTGNKAVSDTPGATFGGGIYNRGGQVTLTNTPVRENEADNGNGRGVYLTGPGIFGRDATLALVATTISDNDAGDTGCGVFNTNDGVVTLDAQSAVVDNDPNNCVGTAACPA